MIHVNSLFAINVRNLDIMQIIAQILKTHKIVYHCVVIVIQHDIPQTSVPTLRRNVHQMSGTGRKREKTKLKILMKKTNT